MPHDLTPEQREALAAAAVKSWPFPTRVDDLAPVIERLLADERERIAREIEATADNEAAHDFPTADVLRRAAQIARGAGMTADEKPVCSCPTDAEIRAAIHHSHQQLTGGNTK